MGMLHKRSLMYKERKDLVSEECMTIPKVLVFFTFLNLIVYFILSFNIYYAPALCQVLC